MVGLVSEVRPRVYVRSVVGTLPIIHLSDLDQYCMYGVVRVERVVVIEWLEEGIVRCVIENNVTIG